MYDPFEQNSWSFCSWGDFSSVSQSNGCMYTFRMDANFGGTVQNGEGNDSLHG